MIYQFRCRYCISIICNGLFEVEQFIHEEHKANCPECGEPGQRVYNKLGHYYNNPKALFHEDGSYEEAPINPFAHPIPKRRKK